MLTHVIVVDILEKFVELKNKIVSILLDATYDLNILSCIQHVLETYKA